MLLNACFHPAGKDVIVKQMDAFPYKNMQFFNAMGKIEFFKSFSDGDSLY